MIIDVNPSDLPLCPNQHSPIHPLHLLHVQLQDASYKSVPVNEETLEYEIAELTKMHSSISEGRFSGRMYLYKDGTTVVTQGNITRVESWYYRCYICALVLPAQVDMSKR
jgi:hypothetical protein